MFKKLLLSAAVVLASVAGSFAQFNPQAEVPADPAVRKGVLDNGLTYYIRHNAKPEGQAEFYIYNDVGAIQEEDSQKGLAHFLEHMGFNGTKNFPGNNLIKYLESVGVKFGANLNAGTGVELTFYQMSSVPVTRQDVVDSVMLILHDWAYFINLNGEDIDKERGVILEELRTGNTADRRAQEKAMSYIYGDTRYAHRNVIGDEEGLKTFSHKEIRDFYHRWYRTDLQAIVIVGDIDVDKIEAQLKNLMADIPAVKNPEPKQVIDIPENEEPIVGVITDPELTETSVELIIKREAIPTEYNSTNIVQLYNMVDYVISNIVNERLRDMAQKPGAPFTNASLSSTSLTPAVDAIYASANAREGESLKAFEAIYTEMERIARHGFNESEFERAKTNILRSIEKQYDGRNDRRNGNFPWTFINNFRKNSPMPSAETEYELDKMLLDMINVDILNQFATMRITRENQIALVTMSSKGNAFIPTQEDVMNVINKVRASEIAPLEDNTVKEPLIPAKAKLKGSKVKKTTSDKFGSTVWTLKNGIKVVVLPTDYKADEVLISIEADGGMSLLSNDQIVSANLVGSYIQQAGVGKFNSSDLRKQLSGKSVSARPYVSSYSSGISGSASTKDIETFMQLVYLHFNSPRFDKSDFDVMLDKTKTSYKNMDVNPMFVFQKKFVGKLFADNPRRKVLDYDMLDKADFEQVKAIYTKLFKNAADYTFTIVGDVNLEELKPMVEKYFGSLPASKPKLSKKDDGIRFSRGVVSDRFKMPMQTPKTTIMYVYTGDVDYSLKNVLMYKALDHVLDIRYTASIREEKGGTYGVGVQSNLNNFPTKEFFTLVTFDTNKEMADELMEIVEDEIENIANNGVREDDLAKFKEFMVKQHPDDLKKNNHWLNIITEYHSDKVDMNSNYVDLVNGITSDDLKVLAKNILSGGNLLKVIMDGVQE